MGQADRQLRCLWRTGGLHDNGFRNFSPSDVRRFYSDVGYRNDVSEFHLNVGLANNKFSAAATVPPNALRPKAGLLVQHLWAVPQ